MFTQKQWTISAVVLFIVIYINVKNNKLNHPNAGLNVEQLIERHGYSSETHEVTTKDGYILTLYRLVKPNHETYQNRTPILLLHGMFNSAAEYVCVGPEQSLAFLLYEKNYDVWLGNYRGSSWSRKHVTLDPDKDFKFWNFSLDELGTYDVPAFIDYVLESTKKEKLHYMGFSQSGATVLIALNKFPELGKKIRLITAISPAVNLGETRSPGLLMAKLIPSIVRNALIYSGSVELGASNGYLKPILTFLCNDKNSLWIYACKFKYYIVQANMQNIDLDILPVIMTNLISSGSAFQFLHVIQMDISKKFESFDWQIENQAPKEYNLGNISTPIFVIYSKNDNIIHWNTIENMIHLLGSSVIKTHFIDEENFNHLDFIIGRNAARLVYKPLIEELDKH